MLCLCLAAYRDTVRLLLAFVEQTTGRALSKLDGGDIDIPLVAAFLAHLEAERHNNVRTGNVRLPRGTRSSGCGCAVPNTPRSFNVCSRSPRSGVTSHGSCRSLSQVRQRADVPVCLGGYAAGRHGVSEGRA